MDIGGANLDFIQKVNLLAPFGEANPEPRFVIKDVVISRTVLLKNGHVGCTLSGRGGGYLQAIAFRAADTELGHQLMTGINTYFHVAGILKQDSWRGQTKIQFQIQDAVKVSDV